MARSMSAAARLLEEEYARLDRKRDGLDAALKIAERIRKDMDALALAVQELRSLGVERGQVMDALGLPSGLVRAAWSGSAKTHTDVSVGDIDAHREPEVRANETPEVVEVPPAW